MFGRGHPKTGYGVSPADQEDRWERFWGFIELDDECLASLDALLQRMAFEDRPANERVRYTTERLSRDMRRWVHERCGKLDFQSRTKGRDHSDDTGIVIIVRPAYWSFPEQPIPPKKIRWSRKRKIRSVDDQNQTSAKPAASASAHLRPACCRCGTPSLGIGQAFCIRDSIFL